MENNDSRIGRDVFLGGGRGGGKFSLVVFGGKVQAN